MCRCAPNRSARRAGTDPQLAVGVDPDLSLPPALPDSPSAVEKHSGRSHRPRHCCSGISAAARLWRVRHKRLPPMVIDGRPAASAGVGLSQMSPQWPVFGSWRTAAPHWHTRAPADGTVAADPPSSVLHCGRMFRRTQPARDVPVPQSRPANRRPGRSGPACRAGTGPRAARVIAPAHRDDATAVTACLRSARHTACALTVQVAH